MTTEEMDAGRSIYRVYDGNFVCDHTDHDSIRRAAYCEDVGFVGADPAIVVSGDGGLTWKFVNGMAEFAEYTLRSDGAPAVREFAWDMRDAFSRLADACYDIAGKYAGDGPPGFTIHAPGCPNADGDDWTAADCVGCASFVLGVSFHGAG